VEVVEAHDDERVGHRRALAVLDAHPDLEGLYVSTVNSMPVLRAVERKGRAGRVAIVTTDLFPALVPHIREGRVAATIYQRPLSQGRLALQALYQFLLDGTRPPARIKVLPHVVIRSNLELLLQNSESRIQNPEDRRQTTEG
jgi:LacI family transcriptional regulator